jgi:hypothetical protein
MLTLLSDFVLHEHGQPTHALTGPNLVKKPLSCHYRRLESFFIVLAVGERVAQQRPKFPNCSQADTWRSYAFALLMFAIIECNHVH